MKRISVAISLLFLFFYPLVTFSADSVVVVPLSSSKGAIKVFDNNGQYLGILVGTDEYIKIFNSSLNLTLAWKKLDGSLPAPTMLWYYTDCTSSQAFARSVNAVYAGFLLENSFNNPATYFSLNFPGNSTGYSSRRPDNGTASCVNIWNDSTYLEVVEYSAAELPITLPIAWPLQYR